MQSDTPQGEPRRQRAQRGPRVTTGFVDPCIISMETTLPGEIPMLVQFWAAGSREVRTPGSPLRWELTDVVVFKSFLHRKKFQWINDWSFKMHHVPSMSLPCPQARTTRLCDLSALFDHIPEHVYQWHIRHLEVSVEARLRQALARHGAAPGFLAPLLLRCAGVDWPSFREAAEVAGARLARPRRARATRKRPSIARRLISFFTKKPKPVSA